MSTTSIRPATLRELRESGWVSKSVKQEIYDNFLRAVAGGEELFPGIIGYDDTVIPEITIALIAQHDMLFLGEKGQAKSRLMRLLARFLDEEVPYLDVPDVPVHEDPYRPITAAGKRLVAEQPDEDIPIAWWRREERYAERLSPGTKFADLIGEIDPAKLAGGTSMSAEDALHFGLIPRMHRGIFAMNELPELDELVQVGLFNILEERDVQIRGYPVRFDLDVLILFSANPATYNRSGKVIPQLKDRIGSVIHTHYPRDRQLGIQIMEQEAGIDAGRRVPGAWCRPSCARSSSRSALWPGDPSTSISSRASALGSASPTIARWSPAPASRRRAGRTAGRAADQRPGAPVLVRRSANWNST